MANGWIVLKRGYVYATRWTGYDRIIRMVIEGLSETEKEGELRQWLYTLIPNDEDEAIEEGGSFFIRKHNDNWVDRWLDLRGLTPANQALFWKGLQRSLTRLILSDQGVNKWEVFISWMKGLLRRKRLLDRAATSPELNNFHTTWPPTNERLGPGWNEIDSSGESQSE